MIDLMQKIGRKLLSNRFYSIVSTHLNNNIMQIDKDNFDESVNTVLKAINDATFYSIDEEMTGIKIKDLPESPSDTLAERYHIMREVSLKYNMIQFGLCTFTKTNDAYHAQPFNFYTFPETGTITMSASAIDFNRTYNMDFQRWIYKGINIASKRQGDIWRKDLKSEIKSEKECVPLEYPEDLSIVADHLTQVEKWYDQYKDIKVKDYDDANVLSLPPINSYLRLAIRQRLLLKYKQKISIESVGEEKEDI